MPCFVLKLGLGCAALLAVRCGGAERGGGDPNDLRLLTDVLRDNARVALAAYDDSVSTARALEGAVEGLLEDPSERTLASSRVAWRVG